MGGVLADSEEDPARMENHADRPEIRDARLSGTGTSTRFSHSVGEDMMYAARRSGEDAAPVAVVRVALPLDRIQAQLADLRRLVWSVAALTAVIVMFLAVALARRLARPLQELTEGAGASPRASMATRSTPSARTRSAPSLGPSTPCPNDWPLSSRRSNRTANSCGRSSAAWSRGSSLSTRASASSSPMSSAAQLLGFSTANAVGRKLWEVVRQLSIQEVVRRALADSTPYREELGWNGPACSSLVVHVTQLSGSPSRGAVLVMHDTSELRRLERVRQDFVANVSHELKTPLSVIKACVETLIDGAVDDSEHRGPFLEQIDDQATRLHALILDLLSLARIESSATAFEMQTVEIAPLVTDCLERHRPRAEAKGQVLEVRSQESGVRSQESGVRSQESGVRSQESGVRSQESGVRSQESGVRSQESERRNGSLTPDSCLLTPGLAAWADEEAVDQILNNLVDNAVKYTPVGGRIRVSWHAEDGHVCLEVSDTGIGIPERDLPRIFERFYRVDKARSREMGGTGLGLSIVKHLVQAMQGSVQASSQLGQGTTFVVRLPRAPGS